MKIILCFLYDFRNVHKPVGIEAFLKANDVVTPMFFVTLFFFLLFSFVKIFQIYKNKQDDFNGGLLFGGLTICLFFINLYLVYKHKQVHEQYITYYTTQYYNITDGKVSNCRYYKQRSMNKLSRTQLVFKINGEEFRILEDSFGKKIYEELSIIQNDMHLRICHLGNYIFTIEQIDCKK